MAITQSNPLPMPRYAKLGYEDLHEFSTEELWSKLTMSEKITVLQELDKVNRSQFFNSLPKDEQDCIINYLNQSAEDKKRKAAKECVDMMDIIAEGDLNCMLITILITKLYKTLEEKISRQRPHKDGRYKFSLPRPINYLKDSINKLPSIMLRKEAGVMTQLMTQALPYYWKEHKNGVGNFYNALDYKYIRIIKKELDDYYKTIRRFVDRYCNEYNDIIAYTISIGLLSQLMSKTICETSAKLRELRDEEKIETEYQKACAIAKANGTKMPKKVKFVYPTSAFADEISSIAEKIYLVLVGEEKFIEITNKDKSLVKAYTKLKGKILEGQMESVLNDIIDNCIIDYTKFYLSRMVAVVKNGEKMPQGVKDDMNFLFAQNCGYMRVMKDIHSIAKGINEYPEDDLERIDEFEDKYNPNRHKTIKRLFELVMEVRYTKDQTNECLKNIYYKETEKIIKKCN